MKNYRFIVSLSAFEVSGSIEKEKEVKDIQLRLLSDKAGITGLCKAGVMRYCCNDYHRHHDEYQDFFFQAENAIEALEVGLDQEKVLFAFFDLLVGAAQKAKEECGEEKGS